MPDRAKVINRMETICNICKENTWCAEFSSDTIYQLLRDALALMKEQQNQIWEMQDRTEYLEDKLKEQETELCDRCGRVRLKSSRESR